MAAVSSCESVAIVQSSSIDVASDQSSSLDVTIDLASTSLMEDETAVTQPSLVPRPHPHHTTNTFLPLHECASSVHIFMNWTGRNINPYRGPEMRASPKPLQRKHDTMWYHMNLHTTWTQGHHLPSLITSVSTTNLASSTGSLQLGFLNIILDLWTEWRTGLLFTQF